MEDCPLEVVYQTYERLLPNVRYFVQYEILGVKIVSFLTENSVLTRLFLHRRASAKNALTFCIL